MNIVVVGAGLSGVVAALQLQRDGHDVVVVDKGRSPGGRMATRRDGDARFDHGAQFFTARDDVFQKQVDVWIASGLVHEWCRGFDARDGHPRYVATHGMNSLVKDLASGVDVRCSVTASAITEDNSHWAVHTTDGEKFGAEKVLVTAPIPQTNTLLEKSGVQLPAVIASCTYDATVALLAVVNASPNTLGEHGGLQDPDDVFSFIADNARKGVSSIPAVTFHANAMWSSTHFEQSDEWLHAELLKHASPWLQDVMVVSSQVKKWRYATPRNIWPDRFWMNDARSLCVAGDAFGGPKVEGAYLSGHFAALALASH
jgi:renalase